MICSYCHSDHGRRDKDGSCSSCGGPSDRGPAVDMQALFGYASLRPEMCATITIGDCPVGSGGGSYMQPWLEYFYAGE